MTKNKLLLISLIFGLSTLQVSANVALSEIDFPKPPAYRVGISEIPEKQYLQAVQKNDKLEKKFAKIEDATESSLSDLTYADMSIKRLSKEIAQDLEFEEQEMVSDLSLLWQGAAMQSDTINFALYKLANPDADKPDEKSLKKVLSTIASMSTFVGASMGSPIIAGSSLIGGNILGIMSQDTKALNYKYTKVNDADMIILIRKVEDLQQKAIDLYYDYMSAKKQLEFSNDLVADRQNKFELAQQNNAQRELIVITDAYYRSALDKQRNSRAEFFSKRAALEQFVGKETFIQFEQELIARENQKTGDKSVVVSTSSPEQDEEYSDTIQKVEDYTNNLNFVSSSEGSDTIIKNYDEETTSEHDEIMTGSSSNIEDNTNKKKSKIFSKIKKEKVLVDEETEEGTPVSKPQKPDKYSTKGLIFLHGADKEAVRNGSFNSTSNNVNNQELNVGNFTTPPATPVYTNWDLPPLDEIKTPELIRGGYSIHSEFQGDINENDKVPAFQY